MVAVRARAVRQTEPGHRARRRRRRQPGVVAEARAVRPVADRHRRRPGRAVRRTARALGLQLPRRRQSARAPVRRSRPAPAARPRAHRPRRLLRGSPDGRGRRVLPAGGHRLRHRAVPGADRTAERCARPRGLAPAPARRRAGRLPPLGRRGHERAPGRRIREGQPAVRPRRPRRTRGRPLACPDRVPEGHRAAGPRAGWGIRRRHRAPGAARPVRQPQRRGGAARPRRPARQRPQRRPGRPGHEARTAPGRHRQRALRHPGPVPGGHRARGGPCSPQPRRDRRLAARSRHRPPALRRRDGQTVRALPRRGRTDRGARRRTRVPAEDGQARAARPRRPGRTHRDVVAARTHLDRCPAVLPGQRRRRRAPQAGAHRTRAVRDRGEELPRVLPDRARHGAVRPRPGHPLSGAGFGGELGGLLPARDHRGGLDPLRAAVRAVPVGDARRGARHRRRLRLGPPRRGDPVRLRQVRPAQRRPGRERDHLPAQGRGARHGEGARPQPRTAGRLVEAGRTVGFGDREPGPRHPTGGRRTRERRPRVPAAPRHPLRRHGADRPPGGRGRADRTRPDGRPHRAAVGQGRLRLHGAREVRHARARHARRVAVLVRPGGRALR